MAHSKQVIVERIPAQCSDPCFLGLVIFESPERQQLSLPISKVISYILIVLEIWWVGEDTMDWYMGKCFITRGGPSGQLWLAAIYTP